MSMQDGRRSTVRMAAANPLARGMFPAFFRPDLHQPSSPAALAEYAMDATGDHPQEAEGELAPRYPVEATLRDGTHVTIRPIGPQDEAGEQAFVRGLSDESRYFRFMNTLRELPPGMLHRFTDPDPKREIALVALSSDQGEPRQVAVARFVATEPADSGEFAIVVADAMQGKGLGTRLMHELFRNARARGMPQLEGTVLASNHPMLALMHALGFEVTAAAEDQRLRRVIKRLS
jgi:acetyltransferase